MDERITGDIATNGEWAAVAMSVLNAMRETALDAAPWLLAGPITSFATLGVLRRELGATALLLYFSGILLSSVALGLLVDGLVTGIGIAIAGQSGSATEWLPGWLKLLSLLFLALLIIRPLRRRLGQGPVWAWRHLVTRHAS